MDLMSLSDAVCAAVLAGQFDVKQIKTGRL